MHLKWVSLILLSTLIFTNLAIAAEDLLKAYPHTANSYLSQEGGGQYPPSLLSDDNPDTFWHAARIEPLWAMIDFGDKPRAINVFKALPRKGAPEHFWRNATLQASNNGIFWTEVADVSTKLQPESAEWITWYFDNKNTYRYYRLYITSGFYQWRYFCSFAEWQMDNIDLSTVSPGLVQKSFHPLVFLALSGKGLFLFWCVIITLLALILLLLFLKIYTQYPRHTPIALCSISGVLMQWEYMSYMGCPQQYLLELLLASLLGALIGLLIMWSLPVQISGSIIESILVKFNKGYLYFLVVISLSWYFFSDFIEKGVYHQCTDIIDVVLPYRFLFEEFLKKGEFMTWNPYIATGNPGVIYGHIPLNHYTLLDCFIGFGRIACIIQLLCDFVLIVISAYLLFRYLRFSRLLSLAGGLFYFSSPLVALYALHTTTSTVLFCLPLVLLFTLRYFETFRIKYLAVSTLFLCYSCLGCKIEFWFTLVFIYCFLFLILFYYNVYHQRRAYSDKPTHRSFLLHMLMLCIIVGLSVACNLWQISIIKDAIVNSHRGVGLSSFVNFVNLSVYKQFLLSLTDSEYILSLAIIWASFIPLRLIASKVPLSHRMFAPGILTLAAIALFCTLRTDYVATIVSSKIGFLHAFMVSPYALPLLVCGVLYFWLRLLTKAGTDSVSLKDVLIFISMYFVILFYVFRTFEHEETEQIFLNYPVLVFLLLFFTATGLSHWRQNKLILIGWICILFVILLRYHLQAFLINVLGIIWCPGRDTYIIFLFLSILYLSGISIFLETFGRLPERLKLFNMVRNIPISLSTLLLIPLIILIIAHTDRHILSYRGYVTENKWFNPYNYRIPELESYFIRMKQSQELSRITTLAGPSDGVVQPNIFMFSAIQDARIYDSTPNLYFEHLISHITLGEKFRSDLPILLHTFSSQIMRFFPETTTETAGMNSNDRMEQYISRERIIPNTLHPNILKLLNIRYLVTTQPLDTTNYPDLRYTLQEYFQRLELDRCITTISGRSGSKITFYIYKYKDFLPRAFIVRDYVVSSDEKETIKILLDRDFDVSKSAVVERPLPIVDKGLEPLQYKADIINYGLSSVTIDVETSGEGLLVLTDSYYPHWNAYIDGKNREIIRTDFAFRGILIDGGVHRVEFRYEPSFLRPCLLVSIGAWGLVLAGTILSSRQDYTVSI